MMKNASTFHALRLALWALTLTASAASCAATIDSTDLYPVVAAKRLDPPRPGENKVYVDFRDLTGDGLEDEVFTGIEDAVVDRGWELSDDFYTANYVLWADLRLFHEAGTEEGNRRLQALGAIATGAAVGSAVGALSDNWWLGASAGTASAVVSDVLLQKLTQKKSWQMVIDLQLGRKIEGGVVTSQEEKSHSNLASASGAGGEAGVTVNDSAKEQKLTETRVHLEMEQRLIATAAGRRATKEMAREALIPKLISALRSQLPRAR